MACKHPVQCVIRLPSYTFYTLLYFSSTSYNCEHWSNESQTELLIINELILAQESIYNFASRQVRQCL